MKQIFFMSFHPLIIDLKEQVRDMRKIEQQIEAAEENLVNVRL